MRLTFGVEQTPRIVVIDSDGLIAFTQTGWGVFTAEELDEVAGAVPEEGGVALRPLVASRSCCCR